MTLRGFLLAVGRGLILGNIIGHLCGATLINSYRYAATGGGGGAPTFSGAATPVYDTDGGTTVTLNFTISTLTDGYIIVSCAWFDTVANIPNGITFDGTAMTSLGSLEHSTRNANVSQWGLAVGNKAAGTYVVTATFPDNLNEGVMGAMAFTGVHQTTSTGTTATAQGSSTGPTVNVSSATGELVAGTVSSYNGTLTEGAGQTSRWAQVDGTDANDGAASTEAGSSTVTFSYTKGTTGEWTIVATPLKPIP